MPPHPSAEAEPLREEGFLAHLMNEENSMRPDDASHDEHIPCSAEQIVQDERRLSRDSDTDLGRRWALCAVGHQLRAEPELVENSLHIVSGHGEQAVMAAASVLASVLLDGVPHDQLACPIEFPVTFTVPEDVDDDDRSAWYENVKVASAVVSAYAARDADAIGRAAAVMCGAGVFEVMVVLVTAAAHKLDRHAFWFGEAMRAAEHAAAPRLIMPGDDNA